MLIFFFFLKADAIVCANEVMSCILCSNVFKCAMCTVSRWRACELCIMPYSIIHFFPSYFSSFCLHCCCEFIIIIVFGPFRRSAPLVFFSRMLSILCRVNNISNFNKNFYVHTESAKKFPAFHSWCNFIQIVHQTYESEMSGVEHAFFCVVFEISKIFFFRFD